MYFKGISFHIIVNNKYIVFFDLLQNIIPINELAVLFVFTHIKISKEKKSFFIRTFSFSEELNHVYRYMFQCNSTELHPTRTFDLMTYNQIHDHLKNWTWIYFEIEKHGWIGKGLTLLNVALFKSAYTNRILGNVSKELFESHTI